MSERTKLVREGLRALIARAVVGQARLWTLDRRLDLVARELQLPAT